MPHDVRKYLFDARAACEHILRFVTGRTREDYLADILLRSAAERQFEILGEALLRVRREQPDLLAQVTAVRLIIGFRNHLAHQYDVTDHLTVWQTI